LNIELFKTTLIYSKQNIITIIVKLKL